MVALSQKIQHLYPSALSPQDYVIQDNADGAGPFIRFWHPALGPQPTQAELDAVTQEVLDAAALTKLYVAAKALLTADDPISKKEKAFVLVVLDEINLIRSKLAPPLAARTVVQLRTAMENKIDAGQADG